MKLVNETGIPVNYWITGPGGMADCGTIEPDGLADFPGYDNQQNVTVEFIPGDGSADFSTTWDSTKTDQQTEIALVAE